MSRFTIKDLREDIEAINGFFAENGIPYRMFEQGRNGYQAVDLYSHDETGEFNRCDCNVGCGTSRECSEYAWECYHNLRTSQKIKALEAKVKNLQSK